MQDDLTKKKEVFNKKTSKTINNALKLQSDLDTKSAQSK